MNNHLGLIAAVLLTVFAGGSADAAEVALKPSLSVGEEYIDNIYLEHANKKSDYVAHVIPSVHGAYDAPIWQWTLDYAYDRRFYARRTVDDDDAQTLALRSTLRVMKDILALKVQENYGRVSTTAIRDYTQESPVKYVTEYNALDLNPQSRLLLTSGATVTAGYIYRNVWYRDPLAVDRVLQTAYADAAWMGSHAGAALSVREDRLVSKLVNIDRTEVLVGPQYDSGGRLQVRVTVGAAVTRLNVIGAGRTIYPIWDRQPYPVWDGALDHRGPLLELHLETGRSWIEDPNHIEIREDRYVASLRVGRDRTSLGFGAALRDYGWARDTQEEKRSLTVDARHDLTDRLKGTLVLTRDQYDVFDPLYLDNIVTRAIVNGAGARFEYKATESLTAALDYRYTLSRSPGAGLLEYDVNRLMAELTMSF